MKKHKLTLREALLMTPINFWTFFWVVPFLIGSIGLIIASVKHIAILDATNIWEFIFGMGLVLVVLDKGMQFFSWGFDELNGGKHK